MSRDGYFGYDPSKPSMHDRHGRTCRHRSSHIIIYLGFWLCGRSACVSVFVLRVPLCRHIGMCVCPPAPPCLLHSMLCRAAKDLARCQNKYGCVYTLGLLQREGADCTSVGVCDGHDRHASVAYAAFMMSIPAGLSLSIHYVWQDAAYKLFGESILKTKL